MKVSVYTDELSRVWAGNPILPDFEEDYAR